MGSSNEQDSFHSVSSVTWAGDLLETIVETMEVRHADAAPAVSMRLHSMDTCIYIYIYVMRGHSRGAHVLTEGLEILERKRFCESGGLQGL